VQSPKVLHPAFYGCYDWHSSVHGHWMLVRLLKTFPDLPEAQQIRKALNANLTAEQNAKEIEPGYDMMTPDQKKKVVAEVEKALMTTAFGGFLVGQQAVKRMLPKKHGCIVFTGASASVKGYALSAAFAMGKFALRGLAQSMSRELHPKGIHVAHVIIDGGIKSERRPEPPGKTASLLNPTSIAASYLHLIHQPHSAWSSELELRPWVETF